MITTVRNVVSMGDVTGLSASYTFWAPSTDVNLLYGLKDKCINCGPNVVLFQYNVNTGFYQVVGSDKHVHNLLNDESVNQHFGMIWTKALELTAFDDDSSWYPSQSFPTSSGQLSGGTHHCSFMIFFTLTLVLVILSV